MQIEEFSSDAFLTDLRAKAMRSTGNSPNKTWSKKSPMPSFSNGGYRCPVFHQLDRHLCREFPSNVTKLRAGNQPFVARFFIRFLTKLFFGILFSSFPVFLLSLALGMDCNKLCRIATEVGMEVEPGFSMDLGFAFAYFSFFSSTARRLKNP